MAYLPDDLSSETEGSSALQLPVPVKEAVPVEVLVGILGGQSTLKPQGLGS